MRYFVDVGKIMGARGGLSQLNVEEALIVARQLRLAGIQDVHIYNVKTGVRVSEADVELALSKQQKKSSVVPFQTNPNSDRPRIT